MKRLIQTLRARWSSLQDTHDFNAMLQELQVSRVQAMRLAGEEFACEIKADCFQNALEQAQTKDVPVMAFVGSPGVFQIYTGKVHSLKRSGPWYNVLPNFNLHLREDRIESTWLVKKPSVDGVVTSVEIFDDAGHQIAWLFGDRKPGKPGLENWRSIAESL
ncbi:MAG: hypothetical protein OXF73_06145 [Gammaproteobacteria bacterium]|nr:hypothetical protein [Gammaproteobacteria bacterium]